MGLQVDDLMSLRTQASIVCLSARAELGLSGRYLSVPFQGVNNDVIPVVRTLPVCARVPG